MPHRITNKQWSDFERQGFVRLGKITGNEELDGLRDRIDEIMMGTAAVPYDRMMLQLDSTTGEYEDMPAQTTGHKEPTLKYRKMQQLEFDPLFLSYMQRSLFQDICERQYGNDRKISVFRAMFMNKPVGQGTKLPWHQDNFQDMDKPPVITVWMAMDDATIKNGCMEVLPGSHLHYAPDDPTVFLSHDQIVDVLGRYRPVHLECKAGEGLLLHNRLLHTSGVNPTDQPRRAISVCYMDGMAVSDQGQSYSVVFGDGALQTDEVGIAMARE